VDSGRFPEGSPDFADAIYFLKPLTDFTSKTIEDIGVLVVLQILQTFTDLRKRYRAAEIQSINGRKGSNGHHNYQQFPHLGVHYLIQEPLHFALFGSAKIRQKFSPCSLRMKMRKAAFAIGVLCLMLGTAEADPYRWGAEYARSAIEAPIAISKPSSNVRRPFREPADSVL
jgi:hypothetical protein